MQMKRLEQRMRKIEFERAERDRARREGSRRIRGQLARLMVAEDPAYPLVEPRDTDPETYRDIRESVALAQGDYEEADRLAALKQVVPWERAPKRSDPGYAAWAKRFGDRMHREIKDKTDRHRRALAAARKRLRGGGGG